MPEPTNPVAAAPPESPGRRGRLPAGPNLGEVVVEVDSELGRHVLWFPTQERLRARWDWTKLPRGSTSEAGLAKMPTLPGLHIIVNPKERTAKIVDPLGTKEYAKLLVDASAVHKAIWNQAITGVPTVEKRGMDDDALATWLYWLWREVEARHLRPIRGRVPTLEDIADAMPSARIRRKFFDSLAYKKSEGETPAGQVRQEYAESWIGSEPPAAP